VIDLSYFPKDPVNPGRFLCWAVYRFEPWHRFGFYTSEEEARDAQSHAGNDYKVAFGSATINGDDFTEGPSEISA
jgi:hypothetical protein